jgi:hypothetical protein
MLELATDSDWHAHDKGSIVIRKRYAGVKNRSMASEDAFPARRAKAIDWAHMPAIPGIEAVMKLVQPVQGAVLPSSAGISRESSGPPGPSSRTPGQTPQSVSRTKRTRKGAVNPLVRQPSGPSRISVPMDMPFEQAVATFNANTHQDILLLPGTYKIKDVLEIGKALHIVGEDGARIVGRWKFKGDGVQSSIKNVSLEYHANQFATDFERLLHIDKGELLLQDCAVLCPHGYCVWAGGRSVVNVLGCILAGSADGRMPSQSAAAVMNFRLQRVNSSVVCCSASSVPHACCPIWLAE